MSIIEKALEKTESFKPAETHENRSNNNHSNLGGMESVQETCNLEIDFRILEEKGMLIPDSDDHRIREEYRLIKRPLIINAFGEGGESIDNSNLILVTSSLPGEGKTFTAVNLALSIATERDKTVLLVDADIDKSGISTLFNIQAKMGLTDLLLGKNIDFSDALLRTNIPNLSILPAGKRHKHSTELLASESMTWLASEMSKRYSDRIIIFDSPPLMVASQSSVLANHVGQVVVVIESGVTPQHLVNEAIQKLVSCDIVGCVLNKSRNGFGFNYYAYYGSNEKQ